MFNIIGIQDKCEQKGYKNEMPEEKTEEFL